MATGQTPSSTASARLNATYVAYAQSFAWIALFCAITVGVQGFVMFYCVDFVYHSSHRTRESALATMGLMPLVGGTFAVIVALLVFTVPHVFQAKIADLSLRHGRRPELVVLLALPLTVAIAWYSYDYLTPSNIDPLQTEVYQHGMTLQRYAAMFAIQTPISLFGICYHHAALHRQRQTWFILAVLAAVVGGGALWGFELAKEQDQLFKSKFWEHSHR